MSPVKMTYPFIEEEKKKIIGPRIRIGREIQCLPYAGFFFEQDDYGIVDTEQESYMVLLHWRLTFNV